MHYVSLKYITAITKISFPPSIYEIRGGTMNVNRISSTDITDIFAGHFLRGFERDRKKERNIRNVLFFPGHVLCAIYPRPFVTRFSRIGLNAIHEGWRVCRRLSCSLSSSSRNVPRRVLSHIEVIVIISFDFFHGKPARNKFGRCAR